MIRPYSVKNDTVKRIFVVRIILVWRIRHWGNRDEKLVRFSERV